MSKKATVESVSEFMNDAEAAFDKGVFQTDTSDHARYKKVDPESLKGGTTVLEPKPGMRTLRMAYFFSGTKRKASIAQHLKRMCAAQGLGLVVFEIDVMVGGQEHDLLDQNSQEMWLARLEDGDFDFIMLSLPCGSWSRANWANNNGPRPCRNRKHPWGIPHLRRGAQARAAKGNEFIHFSIRAIAAAQSAKRKGFRVMCVLEHPEDLGRMSKGEPASIWQLQDLRESFDEAS